MCGIVGKYTWNNENVTEDLLWQQLNSIKHRGPDDEGVWCKANVGLGHVRLSIIDLSPEGHQPMETADGKGIIVYNGEVYNYQDLKSQLNTNQYRSTSDTEVVLNAIHEKGSKAFNFMEGMFGLAYYNTGKDELLIARDHFGIKPLYYSVTDNKFAFASEIRPLLMEEDISDEPDQLALKEYFLLGYSLDPDTAYKDVKRLPPGHYIKVNANGYTVEKYWDVSELLTDNENGDWFESFQESIKLHAISDVPIGLFLSGGMDSNLILKSLKEQRLIGPAFKAYNAGLEGEGSNKMYRERGVAEQSANYYNAGFEKVNGDSATFMSFEKMVDIIEEPICNPSNFLIDRISEKAKQNGHKVLISGHGGDEVFAGYRRHLMAKYLPYLKNKLFFKLASFYDKFKTSGLLYRIKESTRTERNFSLFPLIAIGLDVVSKYKFANNWITEDDLHEISNKLEKIIEPVKNESYLKQLLILEFSTYLSSQNLINIDKVSMHHSIEIRVPFLYRPLVQRGLSLPDSELINGKKTKAVFRNKGNDILPEFITKQPKAGFNPALQDFVHSEEIMDLIYSKKFEERGMFDAKAIQDHFYSGKTSLNQSIQLMNIATIERWLQN